MSMEKDLESKTGHHEMDHDHTAQFAAKADIADFKADAIEAENVEHNMTVLQAVRAYPMASFWAFVISSLIIMESYDVFLCNNFLALDTFQAKFGSPNAVDGTAATNGNYIAAKWSSAISCSGQLGALIGVYIAGPLTSRVGYRVATLIGLMLLNVFIFSFYFAETIGVVFAAQILEGIPWGIFIANAPAWCSEIVPIQLRAAATQMLQMFWAIGSIIVGGVAYAYQFNTGASSYRIPIALQWMFPTPLFVLIWFCPESPWWLTRKGRYEEAAKSIERLGRKTSTNSAEAVAMMRRVVAMEESSKAPSTLELFKGTDLRRTLIVCFVYGAQNLTGNLIANQATYFFEQAGMSQKTAFALGLITSALQWIFVMLSWILTTYFGRRSIYLWGSFVNLILLLALGIAGSVTKTTSQELAVASFGLLASIFFTLAVAPASWVYIGETSAIRLRPLTTGMGRGVYYIVEIPCIFLSQYMLNPTGANLAGKCGYVWAGTSLVCLVTAYFFLPEMKGRSYREIDILFKRKVSARKFAETNIDVNDDE